MNLRSWAIRLAYLNPDVREHILPLLRVASSDRFAAIRQPRGMKPLFDGNVMAVPLDWGSVGVMKPYDVARAMLPLFRSATNGVAYVLDQNGVFTKPGLQQVARQLQQCIADEYSERYAMTVEYYQDALVGSEGDKSITHADVMARRASDVRVTLTPVTSPTSGKSGLRVVFSPSVERVESV